MVAFLDALCDDNLNSLIIDGKVTRDQLTQAWVLILSEYYELRGDGIEGNEQCALSRDIQKLHNHLYLVDVCVQFLLERYSDSIADSLRQLGYSFRPTSTEPIDYVKQLNSVVQKSKTKYIQLQQLLKQLEQLMDEAGTEKPKREDFERMIIYIEEMQGATYNIDQLTVSKYVMLEKKYSQKVEHLKQLHAKH
jgi:DNA repair ATPase RecN